MKSINAFAVGMRVASAVRALDLISRQPAPQHASACDRAGGCCAAKRRTAAATAGFVDGGTSRSPTAKATDRSHQGSVAFLFDAQRTWSQIRQKTTDGRPGSR